MDQADAHPPTYHAATGRRLPSSVVLDPQDPISSSVLYLADLASCTASGPPHSRPRLPHPQRALAVATEMQAAAAFTARPLHRLPRPPLHIAGAEDGPAGGKRGAPLTRPWCSGSLSVGAGGYGSERVPAFPRQQSWDPYKLLGVDQDASEEEVRSARNFLLKQYSGYEESEEAIEGAYDKIIMNSYSHRKHSKINLKSKLKKQVEESPSWVKALLGCFEVPSLEIISRRFAFFGFIAGWSIATSAETGPAFQLAMSLVSCIYFLNDKMKNLVRASATGLGVFVGGWILGSLLVPVLPAFIIPPTWSIELLTSLMAYVFMFFGCTFLK